MLKPGEHPSVRAVEKVSPIVAPEEPPEEGAETADFVVTTTIPTDFADCEPNGFGSVYGYSPR